MKKINHAIGDSTPPITSPYLPPLGCHELPFLMAPFLQPSSVTTFRIMFVMFFYCLLEMSNSVSDMKKLPLWCCSVGCVFYKYLYLSRCWQNYWWCTKGAHQVWLTSRVTCPHPSSALRTSGTVVRCGCMQVCEQLRRSSVQTIASSPRLWWLGPEHQRRQHSVAWVWRQRAGSRPTWSASRAWWMRWRTETSRELWRCGPRSPQSASPLTSNTVWDRSRWVQRYKF